MTDFFYFFSSSVFFLYQFSFRLFWSVGLPGMTGMSHITHAATMATKHSGVYGQLTSGLSNLEVKRTPSKHCSFRVLYSFFISSIFVVSLVFPVLQTHDPNPSSRHFEMITISLFSVLLGSTLHPRHTTLGAGQQAGVRGQSVYLMREED